jgi:hypothetical protein
LEQLATFRAQVKEIDDELTSKQTGESPLKRQYFHPFSMDQNAGDPQFSTLGVATGP